MDKKLKTILDDLYMIDPELQKKEKELIKIINKFLASCPDTKFDKSFAEKLKAELFEGEVLYSRWGALTNFMSKRSIIFAATGVAVILIVAIPALMLSLGRGTETLDLGFEQKILSTKDGAFGNLAFVSETAEAGDVMPMQAMGDSEAGATLGSDAAISIEAPAPVAGRGGGGGGVATSPTLGMVAPEYMTNYIYRYAGEALELKDDNLKVIKRDKDGDMGKKLAGLFGRVNLGFLNLSKFSNLDTSNISLNEDKDKGYSIYLNPQEETVSISKYWAKWPQRKTSSPLKISDVPEDVVLISIADRFLSKYGINKDIYGAPEVDKSWNRYYGLYEPEVQATMFAPEQISVIYPLLLDGHEVYEQHGSKVGLRVMIDIVEEAVLSIDGLNTQNYTSSNYSATTDWDKVVKFAEAGGLNYRRYYGPESQQPTILELETPKFVYMRYYKYVNYSNEELYVPALMFTIKNVPKERYYGTNVIMVPLLEEMLKDVAPDDGIRPMPLPEPAPMPVEEVEAIIVDDTAQEE